MDLDQEIRNLERHLAALEQHLFALRLKKAFQAAFVQ